MYAFGYKRTFRSAIGVSALPPLGHVRVMSALPSDADVGPLGLQANRFLWFPPHANVSRLPYILGLASAMVIALEEICA